MRPMRHFFILELDREPRFRYLMQLPSGELMLTRLPRLALRWPKRRLAASWALPGFRVRKILVP